MLKIKILKPDSLFHLVGFIRGQIKSSLHLPYYPKLVTSGGAHLHSLVPRLRNGGKPLTTLYRFDRTGNQTPDLPHQ